jgi:hypothetical protein
MWSSVRRSETSRGRFSLSRKKVRDRSIEHRMIRGDYDAMRDLQPGALLIDEYDE